MPYVIDDSSFPVREENYFSFVKQSVIAYVNRVIQRKDESELGSFFKAGDLILTPGYFGFIALAAPIYYQKENTVKTNNLEEKIMQQL